MRKTIYLLPFIALLAAFSLYFSFYQFDPNADVSPSIVSENGIGENQSDTIRPVNFPYPTQWNFFQNNIPNLNAGTVGAMLLFNQYYMNRWNLTDCYILPNTGPNGGPSTTGMRTVTYTGAIRDLTTDGRYLYGGKASTILYKMDTNMALVNQFSLTGNIRAITYDPNRKAFWYCDFAGAISCRDTANVSKGTISTTLAAKYGLGFDSTSAQDSAFVFVWDQGTGTINNLARYYVTPASPVLVNTWTFTVVLGGIAGGAEIVIDPSTNPARLMLLLDYQNVAVVGYKMKDVIVALGNNHEAVRDFKLNQNYPNPFNPKTTITFVLTNAGPIELAVFNTVGEKVATLFNGYTQAGDHKYVFDATDLSSGVYYYTITAGDYKATKKMILVK
jgi:hypothetical protein